MKYYRGMLLLISLVVMGAQAVNAQVLPYDSTNPVIYDNDELEDAYTDEYLMSLASAGTIDLRGIITSSTTCVDPQSDHDPTEQSQAPTPQVDSESWRGQWNGRNCYNRWVDLAGVRRIHQERIDKVAVARNSGMSNIPDPVLGPVRHLIKPTSGVIEDTLPIDTDGSRLILEEAYRADPANPLVVIMGGPLTAVADAYLMSLSDPRGDISDRLIVGWIGGNLSVSPIDATGYNGWADGWASVIASNRLPMVIFPANLGLNIIPVSKCGILPHLPNIPSSMQPSSNCPPRDSDGDFSNVPGPFKDELYFKGVQSIFSDSTPLCGPNELTAGFNADGCSVSSSFRFWSDIRPDNRYHGDTDSHSAIPLSSDNYVTAATEVCFDREISNDNNDQPHLVAQFKNGSQCLPGENILTVVTDVNTQAGASELIRAINNADAYSQTQNSIPGEIRAVNYRAGGEGIAYHDTTSIIEGDPASGNSGGRYRNNDVDIDVINISDRSRYKVTSVDSGEWLEYEVVVEETGNYSVQISIASPDTTSNGTARVRVGNVVTPEIEVVDTGGADNFVLTDPVSMSLTAGTHIMRIEFPQGGFNIDSIEFDRSTNNARPVADPGGPYSGLVGSPVVFNGSGSHDADDDPIVYEWDFGDGSPRGTAVNPTHVYTVAGEYTITLIVNDGINSNHSEQTTVTIREPGGGMPIPSQIEAENYSSFFDRDASRSDADCPTATLDDVDVFTIDDSGPGINCKIGSIKDGEWLQYNINLQSPGMYGIVARASRGITSSGQMRVEVDGEFSSPIVIDSTIIDDWDGFELFRGTIDLTSLAAGPGTMTLHFDQGPFDLDWVKLMPPPASLHIEAEDYIGFFDRDGLNPLRLDAFCPGTMGDDVDVLTTADSDTERNCKIGSIMDGEWLEYNIDIPASGIYEIEVRASRGIPGSGQMRAEVNGEISPPIIIDSTVIDNWHAFETYKGTIDLSSIAPGPATLTLHFDEGPFDLNWVKLTEL